jgi:hypothetical protein
MIVSSYRIVSSFKIASSSRIVSSFRIVSDTYVILYHRPARLLSAVHLLWLAQFDRHAGNL